MSTLSDSTELVATESCLSTTIDGESVILQTDTGTYYGFNEVGTHVWELLQEPHTVEEAAQSVYEEYDVDYERCREDVEELLAELAEKDLVRVESA